jgi:hypothetical protein
LDSAALKIKLPTVMGLSNGAFCQGSGICLCWCVVPAEQQVQEAVKELQQQFGKNRVVVSAT